MIRFLCQFFLDPSSPQVNFEKQADFGGQEVKGQGTRGRR